VWAGCYTVPETGRVSFNVLPESQEMQLGFTEFEKMKQSVPVSQDAAAKALVERVGKRIAAVAPLPNAQWEFILFDSPEVNAFCLPGGKVGVYTGILPITRDEAGLATVLAHEVAHAVARHGGERVSRGLAVQAVGAGLAIGTSQSEYGAVIQQAYGVGTQVGLTLPHSRANEAEADRMGLIYMARAGYDPGAAVGFWQRFAEFNRQAGGGNTPWFLRTHPLDEQRVRDIEKWLPEARAQFREASSK
jgi:predicted Zn-dependent protease